MVGVDRYGFTMLARDQGSVDRTAVRIPFGQCVDTVGEVRTAMIELRATPAADPVGQHDQRGGAAQQDGVRSFR